MGHEVVSVFEVEFPSGEFQHCDHIDFHESDGTPEIARWYALGELDIEGFTKPYPMGLKIGFVGYPQLAVSAYCGVDTHGTLKPFMRHDQD
ncbi:hypothetical protein [Rhizobium sp. BK068]|uniref:hypothetical protein n=1 Tax=unclassified Rhizobium TaxID=2613769 RepID=UPI00183F5D34|nr:hypothetical protein [Rhizobium sp. BK060]MBB4167649.1 hypothetical protein [Rhizobium sp. BK538]